MKEVDYHFSNQTLMACCTPWSYNLVRDRVERPVEQISYQLYDNLFDSFQRHKYYYARYTGIRY